MTRRRWSEVEFLLRENQGHPRWDRGDHTHRLSIADHGPGLTDADKERATRRFWRGNTNTAGTGLGLAIASALAEGCGAGLQLEDTAGGGLTVSINFPV